MVCKAESAVTSGSIRDVVEMPSGLLIPEPPGGLWLPWNIGHGGHRPSPIQLLGICPGYRDIWRERLGYEELVARLRSIPLDSWIEICARLLQVLDFERGGTQRTARLIRSLIPRALRPNLDKFCMDHAPHQVVPLTFFAVLFLLKLAFIHASTKGTVQLRNQSLAILESVFAVQDLLSERAGSTPGASSASILMALSQRSLDECSLFPWARACGVYGVRAQVFASRRESHIREMDREFSAKTGLSIMEFIQGVSVIHLQYQKPPQERYIKECVLIRPAAPGLTQKGRRLVSRTAKALSRRARWLKCLFRRGYDNRCPLDPSIIPLERFPLVRGPEGVYFCMSPSLLANSAIELPVRLLATSAREAGNNRGFNQVRSAFGVILEDYVHFLLKKHFDDRYFIVPKHVARKRADGAIVYAEGAVLVECKGRRLVESTRYQVPDDGGFVGTLKRLRISHAAAQIVTTAKAIIDGELRVPGLELRASGPVASLIVTYETLPVSLFTSKAFQRVLPKAEVYEGHPILQPQIVNLREVEELPSLLGGESLLEILLSKSADGELGLERLIGYCYLRGDKAISDSTNRHLAADVIASWTELFDKAASGQPASDP